MSVNNQLYYKSWTTSAITAETISDVWDYLEEAFTGLDGITFNRDTENTVMYIYLDSDKKMYITAALNSGDLGFLMKYFLNGEECAAKDSSSTGTLTIGYVRTKYGIAWGRNSNFSFDYNYLSYIYTQKWTPTLFAFTNNINYSSSNTYYILSLLHDEIETVKDSNRYLSNDAGNQKFAITNAYSCMKTLNLRHLFRVLDIPNGSYPLGKILVGSKKLFWFGRYALEYAEEE